MEFVKRRRVFWWKGSCVTSFESLEFVFSIGVIWSPNYYSPPLNRLFIVMQKIAMTLFQIDVSELWWLHLRADLFVITQYLGDGSWSFSLIGNCSFAFLLRFAALPLIGWLTCFRSFDPCSRDGWNRCNSRCPFNEYIIARIVARGEWEDKALSSNDLQEETATVVSTVLLVTGITTLLHSYLGTRLPLVQGSSFVYLAPALAIANSREFRNLSENVSWFLLMLPYCCYSFGAFKFFSTSLATFSCIFTGNRTLRRQYFEFHGWPKSAVRATEIVL